MATVHYVAAEILVEDACHRGPREKFSIMLYVLKGAVRVNVWLRIVIFKDEFSRVSTRSWLFSSFAARGLMEMASTIRTGSEGGIVQDNDSEYQEKQTYPSVTSVSVCLGEDLFV